MKPITLALLLCATLLTACANPAPTPLAAMPAHSVTPSPSATVTITPSPVPSPTPNCLLTPGTLQTGILNDPRPKKPVTYIVYLPPCYDQTQTRYPVLYLLHGLNYTETQWLDLGVAELVNALIASGDIPPFIIVFPFNYGYEQPDSDPFGDVLIESLIPHIDATYRTNPQPAYRAIGGISRGGGWAIHLGIRRWQYFSAVGAHSPAIFFADAENMRFRLLDAPAEERPRLYIDIGDSDRGRRDAEALAALLQQYRYEHVWYLNVGRHDEMYWRDNLRE